MLGALYVAGRYWAAGYSDGRLSPAGAGKRRRRVVLGDKVLWAREADLPALLADYMEAEPAPAPQPVAKARKRPAKAPPAPSTQGGSQAEPQTAWRPVFDLLAQAYVGDDGLTAALEEAALLLLAREREEDDIEMLVLA